MPGKKGSSQRADYYITRMEYANVLGWNVRVYVDSAPVEPKLFSDGVYGGKRKALAAARKYRDRIVRKYKVVPISRRKQHYHVRDARNASGYVGVTLQRTRRSGRTVSYSWIASFMKNGKQHKQSFSIREYGYERAFRNAVRCRYENTGRKAPGRIMIPAAPRSLRTWLDK